jgi:glycosyltransferase involved in cell wall biosynthesis
LPSADIVAQSSHTEGLPNVLLEASAAGVAVVATDVGGTREIIHHGENGYLVPAGDTCALSSRIVELVDCSDTRRMMGNRGQRIVADAFTFARQSAQYESLFLALSRATAGYTAAPEAGRSFAYAVPIAERAIAGDHDSPARA